jgi:antitoxin component HigA of HigAB toxin-antitoxin module
MKNTKPITSEEEYELTLKEIEKLMDRPEVDDPNTSEHKQFLQLIRLVEMFEDQQGYFPDTFTPEDFDEDVQNWKDFYSKQG